MSEKTQARELAYRTWIECGQNFSETERRLKRADLGLPVSRQTLMAWAQKYDWKNRAASLEAEMQRQAASIAENGLVAALGKQKQRYEDYFEALAAGVVDNQACYAFCGLVKTMIAVRRRTEDRGLRTEDEAPKTENEVPARVISGDEERIAALEELVDVRIGRVLGDPEKVNAGTFREIREALAVIEQLKTGDITDRGRGKESREGREEDQKLEAAMRGITSPEDAREALWEAFSRMINAMLDHPEKIKVAEIERAQAYLARMTERADSAAIEDGATKSEAVAQPSTAASIGAPEEAVVLTDVGLMTEEEAIEALQNFVRHQLWLMQTARGVARPAQVKAVKDAMELIEVLRRRSEDGRQKTDKEKRKGLSSEMAEELRRKLLMGEGS